jgi:hypothetical protein
MTPVHAKSFNQNGAVQPVTNGQAPAVAANNGVIAPPQPDPLQGGFGMADPTAVS